MGNLVALQHDAVQLYLRGWAGNKSIRDQTYNHTVTPSVNNLLNTSAHLLQLRTILIIDMYGA